MKAFIARRRRTLAVTGATLSIMALTAGPSFAACVAGDPCEAIGNGAETVKTQMIEVGAEVLPYAATLVALTLGWRFARRFLRA